MTPGPWLDYLALGVVLFGVVVLAAGFMWIHELPATIAKRRNHPQLHSIEAGCWLSLISGGMLWPVIFIWSLMHRPAISVHVVDGQLPGGAPPSPPPPSEDAAKERAEKERLAAEVADLKTRLARLEAAAAPQAGG